MSNCVYSDPKLKKVHYHMHYKKEGEMGETCIKHDNRQVFQANQMDVTNRERQFQTGFINIDTTPIETIDINQKLLAERDQLSVRVRQLEEQLMSALDQQKNEIISSCETQFTKQLKSIEVEHSQAIDREKGEQQDLIQQLREARARVVTLEENTIALQQTIQNLERKIAKQSEKYKNEKEVLKREVLEQSESFDAEIQKLRENNRSAQSLSDKSFRTFFEEQISNLKQQMIWKDSRICKLEADCSSMDQQLHLKTMELGSIQLQSKIQMQEQLDKFSLQRNQTESEKQVFELKRQYEKIIQKLEQTIDKQREKILQYKIESSKVPVKPEPIIIERPVQIETVVENIKYIPIERVVKESGVDRRSGGGVLLAKNDNNLEKENELINHYEDIIQKDAFKIDTLQRKINTLTKLNRLQMEQQSVQDVQVFQANNQLLKMQVENENLKEGLVSFEKNLANAQQQFDQR